MLLLTSKMKEQFTHGKTVVKEKKYNLFEEQDDEAEVNGADINPRDEMNEIPDVQIRRKRIRH